LLDKIKSVNIEIKSESLFGGQGIIRPLISFLDKHDIDDRCMISSFNPLVLWGLKLKRQKTIIGYLYNRNRMFHSWSNLIWMVRIRPDNLHIHYSLLDSWIVRWARGKGMRINSYTINEKDVYDQVEIDGAFTDNIEYLK
jgi:glycerophosphoryl diester phosphodiesterase